MATAFELPHWDGCTVHFAARPGAPVHLLLDGEKFRAWAQAPASGVQQSFAFPPNGRDHMQLQFLLDGLPAHAAVDVAWGKAGVQPVVAPAAAMRLPDPHAEMYAPDIPGAGARAPVVIIVPVYNAASAFLRCLTALREHTPAGARLLLIDDASTDPGIASLLQLAAGWPNVEVLRNARNSGFTGTVNRGLDACEANADVVLLNADTEVGPGWLGGLRQSAWSRPEHATATAVSDNAGAFSVPELEQVNLLPQGWHLADAARCLLQQAGRVFPRLPTGNGFCMYIRHDARAAVGKLDAAAFPAGYGEENDWCQRAEQRGWRHVIAGSVLVGHARSQSFGDARRQALGQAGMQVLRQRYPDYEAKVGAQLFSFERLVLDWRVRRAWRAAGATPRPRVLLGTADAADAWSGWLGWSVQRDQRLCRLLDAQGNERAAVPLQAASQAFPRWLQRFGFEAASGVDAGTAQACTALGIPVADAPGRLGWSFRRT